MASQKAEQIYAILNSREFRRSEPYEGDKAAAIDVIDKAIAVGKPIPAMMYWGTCTDKENTNKVDQPEQKAIEFIANNMGKVSEIYEPGVDLNLVFVDTHVKFNGVEWTDAYLKNLEKAFNDAGESKGVRTSLSLASEHVGFTPTADGKGFKEFDKLEDLARQSRIPDELADALAPRAANYYKRTDHDSRTVGRMYYELCGLERDAMGDAFKDQLFITYNPPAIGGSKHFGVPTGMAALPISSFKRGSTDKPWNVTQEQYEELMQKPAPVGPLTKPPCDMLGIKPDRLKEDQSLGVVGGGLAGLMSAYQAVEAGAKNVTLYEQGSENSYRGDGSDDSRRVSLGSSPTRTIRMFGQKSEVGRWNIRETIRVLDALQKEIDNNPSDYPELQGKKLFHPEASVVVAPSNAPNALDGNIATLEYAEVAYSKLSGKELKARFPGIYNTVPDDAVAMVEEPHTGKADSNEVAGMMDTASTMQALQTYLKLHGAKIQHDTSVESVDEKGDKAVVKTNHGTAEHDHVILAPGKWLGEIKDGNGDSLTERAGIKHLHQRVVVADIDFKALGLETNGIPFTKGWAPEGGKGVFYRQSPDGKDGHVKFLAGNGTKTVEGMDALHAPVSDAEKEDALEAASKRFDVPVEKLKEHTTWSACTYTMPAKSEKVLVAPISKHVTISALDSSGSARISGGLGAIAAHIAMGLDEPKQGANEAFGLKAHYELVNGGTAINCGKCEEVATCERDQKTQVTVGGK